MVVVGVQVGDWEFHKRICSKPKPADAADKKKPESAAASPAPAPAPDAAPKPSNASTPATKSSSVEEFHASDDEDAAAIKEASRGCAFRAAALLYFPIRALHDVITMCCRYRYFARKLDDHETALIGDIRPKRVDEVSAPTAAATAPVTATAAKPITTVTSTVAAASSTPVPIPHTTSNSSASAWNSAGTFEERDFSKWFKDRLKELIGNGVITADAGVGVGIAGSVTAVLVCCIACCVAWLAGASDLVVTGLDDYEGSVSIIFTRGAPRRIFDVKFKVRICFMALCSL